MSITIRRVSGCISLAVPMFAFAFNQTEERRMAYAIKGGMFMPTYPATHDKRFCQFPTSQIKNVIHGSPNQFCGLVGVKSTGKSTELIIIASQEQNVVYVVMDGKQGSELDDVLYETMYKKIWKMPWFLSQIRLTRATHRRKVVENVFSMVLEDTKVPVTIVLDLSAEKELAFGANMKSTEGMVNAVSSGATIGLSSFSPRQFVKEIKHYVADARSARCIFAAAEGLLFQDLSHYEHRLRLFIAGELSLDIATQYLVYLTTIDMPGSPGSSDTNVHLGLFPRTFASLTAYYQAVDKEIFARNAFGSERAKIETSFCSCSTPWLPFARHPALSLYMLSLQRPIRYYDIRNLCNLSESQFLTAFVKTNIFQLTKGGEFILQFDVTKEAVEAIVKENLPWYRSWY